jgi:ABC-type phosphate transport system substrate-binding protein
VDSIQLRRFMTLRRASATLLLALLFSAVPAAAGDVAVIVHPEVSIADLEFADLRKIMLGDRQFWSSGQKVTLIVAKPVDPGRSVLLEKVYNMSEQRFRQFWIGRVFRGESPEGPKVVISSEGVMEMVSVLDGSIAFVDIDDVPSGVKVISIDGLLPGDAKYALHAQ